MSARILIIEDDANIPVLLSAWLDSHTEKGILLDTAPSMELGMERAKGAQAIVLDLTLPPWDKAQTMGAIPCLRQFAPVVILTGHSTGDKADDAKFCTELISEHGADAVVFKEDLFKARENIGWFFLIVQSAIARRMYRDK